MEDLSGLTLRELLTLARERLGAAASGLKTRAELVGALTVAEPVGALTGAEPRSSPAESRDPISRGSVALVTRDFFRHRTE